jgi:hypothetical protein
LGKNSKAIIVSLLCFIITFLLFVTWFYPYSFFSVYKTYSFKADPVVIKRYVKEIDTFKNGDVKNSKDNLTKNYTQQYILQMYEQDWLTHEKRSKMNIFELNAILQTVRETKDDLLQLMTLVDYSKEEKQYLVDCIKDLSSLENEFTTIELNKNLTRSKVNTEFNNLSNSFFSCFLQYRTFYEIAQDI